MTIQSQLPGHRLAFLILTIIYTTVLFSSTALQHFLLGSQVWDLSIFEQFNWLIANGQINTVSSLREITPLQDHFSLLLLPIALVYKLIPNAYTLLALQSLALGSLTALSTELCRRRNISKGLTWALAIAITLNPHSFLVNRGDFHPDVLTLPLMLLAITETTKKRCWLYYTSLLFTLFAKNAQALFGFGLALYALARGQRTRAGITAGLSLAWWLIATEMSSAGGDHVNIRLGYLGSSKLEILTTLLTRPWSIFAGIDPSLHPRLIATVPCFATAALLAGITGCEPNLSNQSDLSFRHPARVESPLLRRNPGLSYRWLYRCHEHDAKDNAYARQTHCDNHGSAFHNCAAQLWTDRLLQQSLLATLAGSDPLPAGKTSYR